MRDLTPFELLLRTLAKTQYKQRKLEQREPLPVDVFISRALQRHDVYQYEPQSWHSDYNG